MLLLKRDAVELLLRPSVGGSIASFDFEREAVFRAAPNEVKSVLDTASFPLVPFSGRIANGRFPYDGKLIGLPENFPGRPGDPNTIHGQGWLLPWRVDDASTVSARMSLDHQPGAWPWCYRAEQGFDLHPNGFIHRIALTNLDARPMPAGLGVHPYFPRNAVTRFFGLHSAEWQTGENGIPREERLEPEAIDWWRGAPVEARLVDTAYGGRSGDLRIDWPDRGLGVSIRPSPALSYTVVYVPAGEAFFCVEPVSHVPNAHNALRPQERGLRWLAPGERWAVEVDFVIARSHRSPGTARHVPERG